MRNNTSNLLYPEISYKIRGACFDIYNKFGSAREKTIERALAIELQEKGLNVDTQVQVRISHRGQKVGTYLADMVVENKIVVELKSKPHLTTTDKKQFWEYLKQSKYRLGFLVGFTSDKLIIKRFVYDKVRNKLSA